MPSVPTDAQIAQSVQALFAATAGLDRIKRWHALVPTEAQLTAQLPKGQTHVTHVPIYEFRELLEFVDYFADLLNSSAPANSNTVRIMLMAYCHIMESAFLPGLLWNQLRLLANLSPSWKFIATTPKAKTVVCEYPSQKYREIQRLARDIGQPIGNMVGDIWDNRLRNAFSHSSYWLSSTNLIPSAGLSPISRKGCFGSDQSRSFPFTEIRHRYLAARALLAVVAAEHTKALGEYKSSAP